MNVASILRHWFTLAATAFTAWLLGLIILSPEEQAAITRAMGDLVGPLVIVGTLIITALWRMALSWAGKTFGRGAEDKDDKPGGGYGLLLCLGICTAALGDGLPPCAASARTEECRVISDQ